MSNFFPDYTGPINRDPDEGEARISIYGYAPGRVFALVGTIVFALLCIAHAFHMRWKGTRTFHGLLLFGCVLEVVGYVFRIRSSSNPFVVNDFVIQYFLLVTAPVFMSAVYYISLRDALDRLPREAARRILAFKPSIFVAIFITVDVVTTIVQIAGAALTGIAQSRRTRGESSPVSAETANNLLLAGLALQEFSFAAFILVLLWCMARDNRHKPIQLNNKFTLTLLVTSLLFMLRTSFRLAESIAGLFGLANETLFACLEFTPVALAVLIWAVLPVRPLLPPNQRVDSMSEKHLSSPGAV